MLNECFKCGVSGEKVRLYDAISSKGIVKVCGDCNAVEKLPVIKRATEIQIAESQRQKSVRDMLAGTDRGRLAGREMSLRELVDKNLKERLSKQPSDLIDNFQWTIQRVRRNRKITREQFARGIGESEATVRMLESGVLPNNDYKIITKTENFLGISLKKQGVSKFPESPQQSPQPRRAISFDRESAEKIKIADLRGMRKRQEEAKSNAVSSKKPIDSWEEETSQDDEKFLDTALEDEEFFDDEGEK